METQSGKKNVLVIGGGGREHAVIWKLSKSEKVGKIYAIPGNGGIASLAECHGEIKATDVDKILAFIDAHDDIHLTVVTPDDSLALGLVNEIDKRGRRVLGPTKEAAIIEYSKSFAKDFMKKYGIPTAAYEVFNSYEKAAEYLNECTYPTVIKADGLALGKGAIICKDHQSAITAVREIMLDKSFGKAGDRIVIEEYLNGYEVSFLAFVDGDTICSALPASDYKRAFDGNQGLNTGGMGCICPVPKFDAGLQKKAYDDIMLPTVRALRAECRTFKGVLYFELMVCGGDIKVIEYNARFGDPETQVILPMLDSDLYDIFEAVIDGNLKELNIKWQSGACVCVVAASGGYPLSYEKGKLISFSGDPFSENGAMIFHAGTKLDSGKYFTSGGRVLGISAKGCTHAEARETAYKTIEQITFDGMFYRKDICKGI